LSKRKTSRTRRRLTPRDEWLPALLRVAFTGIIALLSVNPPSRATEPVPGREDKTIKALTHEAEQIVTRVLEAYPREPDSHALMGRLRSHHGRTKEAGESWERCLELDPQRADIHDALARAAWERGEFERSAAAGRQALRIDPTMPGVQLRLGRSLLELGQIEEAIAVMEQAVSRSGAGYYYLAQAYMQSKAYGKARDSYQRAVEIHPDNAQAYYGLAQASIRLGEPEKASQYQEEFRKYGVEDPESIKAQKRRPRQLSGLARERGITANACTGAAGIYRRHGNLKQAERLWRRAAVIDPNNSASRKELLTLYEQSGRLEDARTFFEHLTQMPSKNAWDYFLLAQVCARLGYRADALTALEQALKMDPENAQHRLLYRELKKAG